MAMHGGVVGHEASNPCALPGSNAAKAWTTNHFAGAWNDRSCSHFGCTVDRGGAQSKKPSSAEADETTHQGGLGHEASNPHALPGSNAVEDHERNFSDWCSLEAWCEVAACPQTTSQPRHPMNVTSQPIFKTAENGRGL
jgi:hypothetical protein